MTIHTGVFAFECPNVGEAARPAHSFRAPQPGIRSMFTMNPAKNAHDHVAEINRRQAEGPARITAW
jgi:hypothetical protein